MAGVASAPTTDVRDSLRAEKQQGNEGAEMTSESRKSLLILLSRADGDPAQLTVAAQS